MVTLGRRSTGDPTRPANDGVLELPVQSPNLPISCGGDYVRWVYPACIVRP
jgi:hypothetical protein